MAMPALNIKYSLKNGDQFLFSYKKGINRPNLFQLNPYQITTDPFLTQKGNPDLEPAIKHDLNLDYSWTFGSSFLRTGIFYSYRKDVFEYLTVPGDDFSLGKEMHNLGNMHSSGIRTSGSVKLHSKITINPFFELFYVRTNPNEFAQANHIIERAAINYKTALSAIVLLQEDLSLSLSASYNSPLTGIQNDYHEDILYFVSLEKTFFGRLKAGITSAIPFKKKFTYQGYNIAGNGFEQTINKDIRVSLFPVWLKIRYSFASGRKATRIKRDISFEESRPKKGF
jgi:hypothetical protein